MFTNSIILAISSSLDSLGIGITYGIKNMNVSKISKIVLFIISCLISYLSVFLGRFLSFVFSDFFIHSIGSFVLIFIGFSMIIKSFIESKNKKNNYYDFNCSNLIEPKETLALGIALSLDSFGIGISFSLTNSNFMLFPIFIGLFQVIFICFGCHLGKKVNSISCLPNFVCNIISGLLLILIGILKI